MPKTPLESPEQIQVINWCDQIATLLYPDYSITYDTQRRETIFPIYAVPNGQKRDKRIARTLKKEGVRRGVLDLFLLIPSENYAGLIIEMKRLDGGVLSADQETWLTFFQSVGFDCAVCNGSQEAIDQIQEYMKEVQND